VSDGHSDRTPPGEEVRGTGCGGCPNAAVRAGTVNDGGPWRGGRKWKDALG